MNSHQEVAVETQQELEEASVESCQLMYDKMGVCAPVDADACKSSNEQ